MSLIISTGTNLGDRLLNLSRAKDLLCSQFELIAQSSIVESKAVDYLNQPDFLNQCLEFTIPSIAPGQCMDIILEFEQKLGRIREISKGPRLIDIDIIFWQDRVISLPNLTIPHESWAQRSFIAKPITELPYYQSIKKCFKFPQSFENTCRPYNP